MEIFKRHEICNLALQGENYISSDREASENFLNAFVEEHELSLN